jgi:hypothetical protein
MVKRRIKEKGVDSPLKGGDPSFHDSILRHVTDFIHLRSFGIQQGDDPTFAVGNL